MGQQRWTLQRGGGDVGVPCDELFPAGVVVEISPVPVGPPSNSPYAVENEAVAGAIPRRRSEFTTGRECARRALAKLGVGPVAIPIGESRAPVWPEGVVGSITHDAQLCVAVVARASAVTSIGVDVEPNEPLPAEVLGDVLLPEERTALPTRAGIAWDRLVFSMKESIYKAWFPLTRAWLDFTECIVRLYPEERTFSGTLLVPGPTVAGPELRAFHGRWTLLDGHLLTGVTVGV